MKPRGQYDQYCTLLDQAEKSKKQTFFIKKCFEDPELKDWIFKVEVDKASASRKVCRNTINLSALGISSLKEHSIRKKHKAEVNEVHIFMS